MKQEKYTEKFVRRSQKNYLVDRNYQSRLRFPELRDRDWLDKKRRILTRKQIAQELGCSLAAVTLACVSFEINGNEYFKDNTKGGVRRITKEVAGRILEISDFEILPSTRIADRLITIPSTVKNALRYLKYGWAWEDTGIQRARILPSKIPQLNDRDYLKEQLIGKGRSLQSIADEIGCTREMVRLRVSAFGFIRKRMPSA